MRTMIAAGSVAVLLAGGFTVEPAAAQDWERAMKSLLVIASDLLRSDGYVPARDPRVGNVNPGEIARVEFYLQGGVRYGVLGACLCDEFDFEMHDSSGLVLHPESTGRDKAVVLFVSPAATGTVAFDAIPDECGATGGWLHLGCAVVSRGLGKRQARATGHHDGAHDAREGRDRRPTPDGALDGAERATYGRAGRVGRLR